MVCFSILSSFTNIFNNILFRYEAGDHIAVYASNNPVDVDKLCKLLGVDGEQTFSLENVDGNILNKLESIFAKNIL